MIKTGISENICSKGNGQIRGECRDYYCKDHKYIYAKQLILSFVG
jgi:hypothetical protein